MQPHSSAISEAWASGMLCGGKDNQEWAEEGKIVRKRAGAVGVSDALALPRLVVRQGEGQG